MTDEEIADSIEDLATNPKRMRNGDVEVEEQDVDKVAEALRVAQAARAARRPLGGMRISKLIPPGSI